jgi:carbamoyl-phosphate synthase large subunit
VGGDVHPPGGGRNRLSTGKPGTGAEGGHAGGDFAVGEHEALLARTAIPREDRLEAVEQALRAGCTVEEVAEASKIDPWFLDQIARIVEARAAIEAAGAIDALDRDLLWRAKRLGFSDRQLAALVGATEGEVRTRRRALGVEPVYRAVDTCAGEFEATTPYYYSTYEEETEVPATGRRRVVVLGSGPNRIGQGVEFDTACVHAVQALREAGFETIMVNCNPETVSTDYDLADRLYLEPLTTEDVLEVCRAEAQGGELAGVIVTMGGQTPLQLAHGLAAAGVPLLGTPPEAIDLAEDRGRFGTVLAELGLDAPAWGQARSREEALAVAARIGYPVLARPSYVLGGRSMEVFYDAEALARSAALASLSMDHGSRPVLIDRFLEDAVEVDVDALCDADGNVLVCGVMEHIEEAGVHSGDSACVLPPITLGPDQVAEVAAATAKLARALGVVGILNVQFAFKGERLYVLEANPRASRSVPFVEKVTGLPVGKAAALLAVGARLADLRQPGGLLPPGEGLLAPEPPHVGVKEAVLPFARFPGADSLLGPEMRSTGEVLGLDYTFGAAFAKSQEASYGALPTKGVAFLSVRNADKRAIVLPAKRLADLGFTLVATAGTASVLNRNGVPARVVRKVGEGRGSGRRTGEAQPQADGEPRPPSNSPPVDKRTVVDLIRAGEIDVVINTPQGSGPRADGYEIRTAAVAADIPCITTLSGLAAMVQGIEARLTGELTVQSLQAYHRREREGTEAKGMRDA